MQDSIIVCCKCGLKYIYCFKHNSLLPIVIPGTHTSSYEMPGKDYIPADHCIGGCSSIDAKICYKEHIGPERKVT